MQRIVTTALVTALFAGPGLAASPVADILCEPTERLTAKLVRQFDVARSGRGMQGPDQLMEIWTDRNGDWTLVVTYASGTSCIVAMGRHWEMLQSENPA